MNHKHKDCISPKINVPKITDDIFHTFAEYLKAKDEWKFNL